MVVFFPTPYPDELLYSVFARYHILAGNKSFKHTTRDLYGRNTVRSVIDLPSNFKELVNNIDNPYLTEDFLIDNHTLFNYYTSFLPQKKKNVIKQKMHREEGNAIHTAVGINASSLKAEKILKHCARCIEEDIEKYSETYWHRIHQLPYVEVCPMHKEFLLRSNKSLYDLNQHEYLPASPELFEEITPQNNKETDILLFTMLAEQSQWILHNPQHIPHINYFRDIYIRALQNKGIAYPSKLVDQKRWVRSFSNYYDQDFLKSVNSEVSHKLTNWLPMIVQKHRKSFHPVRHLLVINCLIGTIEDFYKSEVSYEPFGKGPWPCLNPVHKLYKREVIKKVDISYNMDLKKPYGRFECECGYIYTRSGPDISESDKYQYSRVVHYGQVWEEELKTQMKYRKSMESLAKIMGVDPKTIKRQATLLNLDFTWRGESIEEAKKKKAFQRNNVKQSNEGVKKRKRDEWLELKQLYPEYTPVELGGENPALYSWLRRYDGEWYQQNKATSKLLKGNNKNYDWDAKDSEILINMRNLVLNWSTIEVEEGLKRKTKTSLAKRVRCPAIIEKHIEKLPKTNKFLCENVETVDEFRLRRIEFEIKKLSDQGEPIKKWVVYKRAGIDSKHMSVFLKNKTKQLLLKYTE